VVAGNGSDGFSGDGGPATEAELSDVTDLAFAPNGDLFLSDDGRVRVVDQQGIIETVVGDGGSPSPVVTGTPAVSAALGQVGSLAINTSGVLYLSTSSQLLLLGSNGRLQTVAAIGKTVNTAFIGTHTAPFNSFGQLAVDGHGDVYASSIALGWSFYEITPDGTATYLGAARGIGGTLADVQPDPKIRRMRETEARSTGPRAANSCPFTLSTRFPEQRRSREAVLLSESVRLFTERIALCRQRRRVGLQPVRGDRLLRPRPDGHAVETSSRALTRTPVERDTRAVGQREQCHGRPAPTWAGRRDSGPHRARRGPKAQSPPESGRDGTRCRTAVLGSAEEGAGRQSGLATADVWSSDGTTRHSPW
jgi:hypothetical protein